MNVCERHLTTKTAKLTSERKKRRRIRATHSHTNTFTSVLSDCLTGNHFSFLNKKKRHNFENWVYASALEVGLSLSRIPLYTFVLCIKYLFNSNISKSSCEQMYEDKNGMNAQYLPLFHAYTKLAKR